MFTKTLINTFPYPRLGPGMMWEARPIRFKPGEEWSAERGHPRRVPQTPDRHPGSRRQPHLSRLHARGSDSQESTHIPRPMALYSWPRLEGQP